MQVSNLFCKCWTPLWSYYADSMLQVTVASRKLKEVKRTPAQQR